MALSIAEPRPLRLFISYAHEDDSLRRELEDHLSPLKRQGTVEIWSDRSIEVGQKWEESISERLKVADIILLLISRGFLASKYIYDRELALAMERHESKETRVIPVFLRPCDWEDEVFGKLQGVPDDAKPITEWDNRDRAFTSVARAIRKTAEILIEEKVRQAEEQRAHQEMEAKVKRAAEERVRQSEERRQQEAEARRNIEKRLNEEIRARQEAEERILQIEERLQQETAARQTAAERARDGAEAKARHAEEERTQKEAEGRRELEKRLEQETRLRSEAERRSRQAEKYAQDLTKACQTAEEQARQEAEARRAAEEQAQRAQEHRQQEAEAKQELEKHLNEEIRIRGIAQEHIQQETAARHVAEQRTREAQEYAQQEAAAKSEAEERARQEAEAKYKLERRLDEAIKARHDAEDLAQQEAEVRRKAEDLIHQVVGGKRKFSLWILHHQVAIIAFLFLSLFGMAASVLIWSQQSISLTLAKEEQAQRESEEARRAAEERTGMQGQRPDFTVFRDAPFAPEMVVLPAGEFLMGSEVGRYDNEGPQHRVQIGYRLAIGRYPVTFEEWDAYVADGGTDYRPNDQGWGRGRRPVINVSWNDAKQYVAWLSRKTGQAYRLLSEAEWEYAARAGTTTMRWWGNDITPQNANYNNSKIGTTEVASYPENPFKLYDMLGNTWEWVEDCWNEDYSAAPNNGAAWTTGDCRFRVVRGGSWKNRPEIVRSAFRGRNLAVEQYNDAGFRVVRTF